MPTRTIAIPQPNRTLKAPWKSLCGIDWQKRGPEVGLSSRNVENTIAAEAEASKVKPPAIPVVFFSHRLHDLSDCILIFYPVIEGAVPFTWETRHLWNYNDEVIGCAGPGISFF